MIPETVPQAGDGDGHFVLIQTAEGDAKVRAEPFEAIELSLAALWD